ncbi:MAG: tRNA uridine-5-carboxymethylaminomethyl(34) synthesis GTPase MnmE, partial [Candidatus Weimeria sp.]
PLDSEDREIIEYIGSRKVIVIINKTDLEGRLHINGIKEMLPQGIFIEASVANEEGIDKIEDEIEKLVYGGQVKQQESLMVTNVRHKTLLEEASSSLGDACSMAEAGEALEFLEIDVNRAYEALGEIIGEAVNDDIINEVFARFCLGK